MQFLRTFLQENLSLSTKLTIKEWLATAERLIPLIRVSTSREVSGTHSQYKPAEDNRPAILICDERPPSPDRDAGSARMMMILHTLNRSHQVTFLVCNRPHGIEYEEALWKLGIQTGDAFQFRQYLKQTNCDIVILSRPDIAGAMLDRVRRANRDVKIVYDMLDVHHLRAAREAALTGDPRARRECERLRQLETRLGRASDLIWCGSLPDQKLMAQIAPNVPSEVVPTVHPLRERGLPLAERQDLMFIGSYSHRPNTDAIHYFAREVLPLIRQSLPQVELLVIGGNAPREFEQYSAIGVRVLGHVPDLEPIVARSRVFVAPIRFGSGVNGKIGEALAHGLPVVTTSIGAEGWGFTGGDQVLIADTPDTFATAVLDLYNNEDLWHRLSDAGYQHIAEKFTPQVIGQVIDESLERLRHSSKAAHEQSG